MMNTLCKSPAIAILTVFIFISGLTVDFVGAQNTAEGTAACRRPADLLLSRHLRFGRLTSEDGLSNNQTMGVAQDDCGFMWFGTADGLNRYNGASVKVYRHDPDDPHSLSSNIVWRVYEDRAGIIWLATHGGLNKLDRESMQFTLYLYDSDDPNSLSGDNANMVFEDQQGTLWIGTDRGVSILDVRGKPFHQIINQITGDDK